jgi:mono/diheme cytochrome c family protein
VPLVQRVYSNPDYYWSVRDYYRDANELEKNQQLSALIQALLAKQVGQDHAPAAAARQTVGHRSLGKLPAPVLRGQPVAAVRKGGDAGAYLAGACVRCHGAGRAAGGIDLSNPDAVAPADREACVEAMVDGRMPKGGAAPSLAEVAAVSKWAAGK